MLTASAAEASSRMPGDLVKAHVERQAGRLQAQLLEGNPAARAALARLRRGAGKQPGEALDAMEYTVVQDLEPGPSHEATEQDGPTPADRAAHAALTLFALHQQSRGEKMHVPGRRFGRALRSLHSGPDPIPEHVLRRFRVIGTADTFAELTHHLRGAVQVLRAAGIPLDYGQLARELVIWQTDRGREQIRLAWGRDFFRVERADNSGDSSLDSADGAEQ
jgi:CRISPR system Cascade subunit CasB